MLFKIIKNSKNFDLISLNNADNKLKTNRMVIFKYLSKIIFFIEYK